MSNHFTIRSERSGSAATITCSGELDIAAAPATQEALDAMFADPPQTIELDWSGLTFMDSTGIRLLLMVVKRAGAEGIDLLWQLSDAAQRALDAVGIQDGTLRQLGEQIEPQDS